jgi:glycosyltransferase involved in cell wall biosynthesis
MRQLSHDKGSASPRVSIGMPVFNGEAHIAEAIESVLSQTFTGFELIIADNCSDDRTESICREYARIDSRIRYFRHQQNLGLSANFTFVFNQARGEYFKWSAHDDVIARSYLQRCLETFEQVGPKVVMCFPQRFLMHFDGELIGPDPKARWFETGPSFDRISFARLMRVNAFLYPILGFGLMRRQALARTRLIGGYKYSDLVLVAEMRLLGEFREIPEALMLTRLHKPRKTADDSEMLNPSNAGKTLWPELKLFCERVRSVLRFAPWYTQPIYLAYVMFGQLVVRSLDMTCWQKRRIESLLWTWWESVSVGSLRRFGSSSLPLRIWVLLSGMRNRDQTKLAIAFSRSTPDTEKVMAEFVASKLRMQRSDAATEVLDEWVHGSCPVRKCAAEIARSASSQERPKINYI